MLFRASLMHLVRAFLLFVIVFGILEISYHCYPFLFTSFLEVYSSAAPSNYVILHTSVGPDTFTAVEKEQIPIQLDHGVSIYGGQSPWCDMAFNDTYISTLRSSATSMCSSQTVQSTFTCHQVGITQNRQDAFCVAEGAILDSGSPRFNLDCVPDGLSTLPTYMYDTGITNVLRDTFQFGAPMKKEFVCSERKGTVVLVKRELPGNLWHSLLEIWSFWLTMDALGVEAFSESNRVQIVLTDSHDVDESYARLWTVFSGGKKPVKIKEFAKMGFGEARCPEQVVVPLAGGSNPIWQGDWENLDCRQSELVKTFSDRVMKTFEVDKKAKSYHDVHITFLDRKENRKLIGQERLLSDEVRRYPEVTVSVVDFAELSFGEQLEVISNTTVLVGVHGAGMTHSLFMPPGSSIVDIIPPGLRYKGFENIASLKDIGYFKIQGGGHEQSGAEFKSASWHSDNLEVHEADFLNVFEQVMERYGKT